jgi:mRNA interferase HicA
VKRTQFLKHLGKYGCELLREGASPAPARWMNPVENKRSAVPRHNEIRDILARKICKDLGVPPAK